MNRRVDPERSQRLLGEGRFDRADLDARGEIRNVEREVASKSGERRSILIHLKKVSTRRDRRARSGEARRRGAAPTLH